MSYSTVYGVSPDRRPVDLAVLRNSHGWSPNIWRRLLLHRGESEHWMSDDAGLIRLWDAIEELPGWQQVPLVLTFDTGVIPAEEFEWAAECLREFESRLPVRDGWANHVPAVAAIMEAKPEVPLLGIWGTSVSEDPFDPWDYEADSPGTGIPLSAMYVLERHRSIVLPKAGS